MSLIKYLARINTIMWFYLVYLIVSWIIESIFCVLCQSVARQHISVSYVKVLHIHSIFFFFLLLKIFWGLTPPSPTHSTLRWCMRSDHHLS